MFKYVVKMLVFVILTVFLLLLMSACGIRNTEVYIFSDVSECKAIEQKADKTATVNVYDSPSSDQHLDDAVYIEFYACEYSGEYNFKLYAYEFIDSETAKAYYKRVSSRPCIQSVSYTSVSGMFNYKCTVINDNLVYTVQTKRTDANCVMSFLAEIFTTKIS